MRTPKKPHIFTRVSVVSTLIAILIISGWDSSLPFPIVGLAWLVIVLIFFSCGVESGIRWGKWKAAVELGPASLGHTEKFRLISRWGLRW